MHTKIEPWSPPTVSSIPQSYLPQNFAEAQAKTEPAPASDYVDERDFPSVAYASRPQDYGI